MRGPSWRARWPGPCCRRWPPPARRVRTCCCRCRLALPADPALLQRPLDGAHQAQLTREQRRRNLRGAFMVDPLRRAAIAGRHLALVDDVMTTGATLHEAARVLLRAGAASVTAWVLARTPDD